MLLGNAKLFLRSCLKYTSNSSRNFSRTCCLLNHYETLKVSSSASLSEIKEAYFRLSKECHPDLHPDKPECKERFIQVKEAYHVLSNPNTRKRYDSYSGRFRLGRRTSSTESSNPQFKENDDWLKRDSEPKKQEEADFEQFRREYQEKERVGFNRYKETSFGGISDEEMTRILTTDKWFGNHFALYCLIGALILIMILETFGHMKIEEFYEEQSTRRFGLPSVYEDRRYKDHPLIKDYHVLNLKQKEIKYRGLLNREILASEHKTADAS